LAGAALTPADLAGAAATGVVLTTLSGFFAGDLTGLAGAAGAALAE
jgi:hypothetical protein